MLSPIRFDQGNAAALAGELQQAASSLLEGVAMMQAKLAYTVDNWGGTFRSTFDTECATEIASAVSQAQLFLDQAARVEALALEAQAANQLIAQQNAQNQPTPTPVGTPTATPQP